jgi:ComF family protein
METSLPRALLRGLSDVFFPPVCVNCRGLVEDSPYRHVCARCARYVEFARPPFCETCGHPLFGGSGGEGPCEHCAGLNPAFGTGRAAALLRGPARALLVELKYHGGRHVLEDMEEIFRRSPPVLEHVRGAVLVPVPLHPRRRRERGFNQSALLAEALARAAGGAAVVADVLVRRADTHSQTAFDRRSRLDNLKNAFALAPGARLDARQRYVLVDDVFTTGSTLNGCARMLRRHGCVNLGVAVFAHG